MHAVWMNLKSVTDGLGEQVKALEDKEGTDSADIANLKSEVDGIKADMASMKTWGDDIAALKKACDTFADEFKSMGVDIDSMKKELASYGDRITALEKVKLPFVVSGDLNFVGLAAYSGKNVPGLSPDGRAEGVGTFGNLVGADKNLAIYHELGINIASVKDDPSKVSYGATVVIGNTLQTDAGGPGEFGQYGFGNQSEGVVTNGSGIPAYDEGAESIYVDRAWVKFATKLASVNTDITVGRQGYQVDSLLYKRPDTAWFYDNARWSDGDWTFDGLNVDFKAGPAAITLFGGRTSDSTVLGANNADGVVVQPLTAGQLTPATTGSTSFPIAGPGMGVVPIGEQLGLQAAIPISTYGKINLAYIWLGSDQFDPTAPNPQPDGVRVYGGDASFNYDGFDIKGSYGKSDVYQGGKDIVNKYDDAWWVSVAKKVDMVGLKAGYEYVGPLYGAPGDWGRIGTWWNPTDVQGWNACAWVNLTHDISLDGSGQWLSGTGGGKNLPFGGATFSTSAAFTDYNVTLKYKPGPYEASLGFENVHAKDGVPGDASEYENWYNIGLGWNASENAKLSLLWQISNANLQSGGVFRGGLIGTQFTVKF
jgi:hypothetical protein